MDIKLKLNLVLAVAFILALAISGHVIDKSLRQTAISNIKDSAIKQMATATAIRKYTTDNVRETMLKDTTEFHAASVPAFSANKTMEYLAETYPGHNYKEVALNPTNPAHLAKGWEKDMINKFRENRTMNELYHFSTDGDEEVLNYLRPIRVSSESCLQCHSTPEAAPPLMIAKYGDHYGFNWKLDEIIGAQIVSVPTSNAIASARSSFITYIAAIFTTCCVFFIALNLMLNNVILKPIQSTNEKLTKIANQDHLTGIVNRRGFEDILTNLVETSNDFDMKLSLILCDIDHFKMVNDSFGHDRGDAVLKEFAYRVSQASKRQDTFCRIGGEEFAVILPKVNLENALAFAEILRKTISTSPYPEVGKVTASFGVVELVKGEDMASLIKRADLALYKAKGAGRNRVEPG